MKRVLITVSGGVAEVEEKSAGVELIIRDYDNEDESEEYSEDIYEADELIATISEEIEAGEDAELTYEQALSYLTS